MKQLVWLACISVIAASPQPVFAQEKSETTALKKRPLLDAQGGNLSLGVRNTISAFGHGSWKEIGTGVGGHFRLQLIDRVNTEWYADIIPTNIANRAHRMDYHVGWSVMAYLLSPKGFTRKFTPFVEAGHCFDMTYLKINGENTQKANRFSSAVQMGVGTHYNITPKFDITLKAQYMVHLGKEIHTHEEEDGSLAIEEHKNAGFEGHMLFTISFNYKIVKLWKARI